MMPSPPDGNLFNREGECAQSGAGGLKLLLRLFLIVDLLHVFLDVVLDIAGGSSKFAQSLAQTLCKLRDFFRTEEDQNDKEDEYYFWRSEVHTPSNSFQANCGW